MLNGQIITIPRVGELKVGLLKAAIKKAGLTEEEFLKLLWIQRETLWNTQ
jgi:hypothetical protein